MSESSVGESLVDIMSASVEQSRVEQIRVDYSTLRYVPPFHDVITDSGMTIK